jgi:hypothetical protein
MFAACDIENRIQSFVEREGENVVFDLSYLYGG